MQFFTESDIIELRDNPTDYVKLNLIGKIANGYGGKILSDQERSVANDILRLLADDISIRIRMMISEKFCQDEKVPYDLIKKLATDIEDMVSVPVIQFSNVLSEQDLLDIIRNERTGKQRAVARRKKLSDKMIDELVENATETTMQTLIDSNHEKLNENHAKKILSNFSMAESVVSELISLNKLNFEDAQGLLKIVSEDLRQQIIYKYQIPENFAKDIVEDSQQTISANLIHLQLQDIASGDKLDAIIHKLHTDKKLNIDLIAKVLAFGNQRFFMHAIAALAQIPVANAERLLEEDGAAGIHKLFEKAQLPIEFAMPAKILYRYVHKLLQQNPDRNNLYTRLIENIENESFAYEPSFRKMLEIVGS